MSVSGSVLFMECFVFQKLPVWLASSYFVEMVCIAFFVSSSNVPLMMIWYPDKPMLGTINSKL